MRSILTILLSLIMLPVCAQVAIKNLPISTYGIGVATNGDSVVAKHFDVSPYEIVSYEYTNNDSLIYLYLRIPRRNSYKKGEYVLCYNLNTQEKVWSRWFLPEAYSSFIINDVIVRNELESLTSVVYDIKTGIRRFTINGVMFFSKLHDVFIDNKGDAVSATTFKFKWDVPYNSTYGAEQYSANEDTLIIAAEGLIGVDVKTGKYWYHETSTGVAKYDAMIAVNAAAVATTILTGYGMVQTSPDRVYGMHSQIMDAGNAYYYAGREEIYRVDKSGNLLWKKTLPEDMTGSSVLWIDNSHVYLLNKGTAYKGGRTVNVAKPYIACYNKTDGTLVYHTQLGVSQVAAWSVKDGAVAMLTKSHLYVINTEDGTVTDSTAFNNQEGSSAIYNPEKLVIHHNSGDVSRMTHGWIIKETSGKVNIFNNKLEVATRPDADYYLQVGDIGDYEMYYGKKVIFLKDGKLVAEVRNSAEPRYINGKQCMTIEKDGILLYDLPE